MKPKNSSPYRPPPIKRTRDSFMDDKNSIANPRIDLAEGRHTQVRRDKDNIRSLGITLYDIDFAVKSFTQQEMRTQVEDNGEIIEVPILYANAEKWASIQRHGYLKDKKGKTLAPLIVFRRSGVTMSPELRKNKVAKVHQVNYVTGRKYSKTQPYDRFSLLNGSEPVREYFITPIPDYVDVTYDFILWADKQTQLNSMIESFVWFGGQSFGEKNWFKFASFLDSISIEDNNLTGEDRLVQATFQLTVHGYLLPKDIAGEVTTKRVLSSNKIQFTSEAYGDIDSGIVEPFRPLNWNSKEELEEYQNRLSHTPDRPSPKSPGVYIQKDDR